MEYLRSWLWRYLAPCLSGVGALLFVHAQATAEKRVALTIGNSAYINTPKLRNPENDASDMSRVLREQGFTVIEGINLNKADMEARIKEFSEMLGAGDLAVFFYAGHGLQVSGQNYLVPTNAALKTPSSLDFETIRLDLVQRQMEREAKTSVLFIDACRDNPLARNLARSMGTRSALIGAGLAPVEAGAGTLISFSTQPGNVALDGAGRNSPFTSALVERIAVSTEGLSATLIAVRKEVMRATSGRQVPWEHSSLTGQVYFKSSPSQLDVSAPPPAAPGSRAKSRLVGEAEDAEARRREAADLWPMIEKSDRPEVISAYAQKYRDTPYGDLALARLSQVRQGSEGRPPASEVARPAQRSDCRRTNGNLYCRNADGAYKRVLE